MMHMPVQKPEPVSLQEWRELTDLSVILKNKRNELMLLKESLERSELLLMEEEARVAGQKAMLAERLASGAEFVA